MILAESSLFSGVQPTGFVHLGNYLGAIAQCVKMQKDYKKSFCCIVDLHAMTMTHQPAALKEAITLSYITHLACGIDPNKTILFVQSSIPQHTELAWFLSCATPIGWLNRMIQFKEKSQNKANPSVGLYTYPILMAADILLYRASHVPVGEDQKQHLELARDIAMLFNKNFQQDFFIVPECVMASKGARVMSLKDGTKKMSKSDSSDNSRINLMDSPDQIKRKIQTAKSDSILGFEPNTLPSRPEASNLLEIYSILTACNIAEAAEQFDSFTSLKNALSAVLIEHLEPIQTKIAYLKKDLKYVVELIKMGNEKALVIAEQNISTIKRLLGLYTN